MDITTDYIPEMTIEEFAEKNGLTMEIHERGLPPGSPERFFARFHRSDIKGDGVLIGEFGNGASPEEAIRNYAARISLRRLVIDAWGSRKEFDVPRLKTE